MGERTPLPAGTAGAAAQSAFEALSADSALGEQSLRRLGSAFASFTWFLADRRVSDLEVVTPAVAVAFVDAPTSDGCEPSVSTRHFRRSALRLLFRVARRRGLVEGDPTLDLVLPPRSPLPGRPLTDEEVGLCRVVAVHPLSATRPPAVWALAEATARTSEIPAVTAGDVDLGAGRVWLHGGAKTAPRWGQLTGWGRTQLVRRLRHTDSPDELLVYRGSGSAESRQASACAAISATLTRAGLGGERDVRPASVPAWAGARLLAETGRIEVVADRLGMRSLDAAARFVNMDWDSR